MSMKKISGVSVGLLKRDYVPYVGAVKDVDLGSNNLKVGGHMAIGESGVVESRHLIDMDGIIDAGGQGIFLVPSIDETSASGIKGMRIRPEIEANNTITGTGSNAMTGIRIQDIGLGSFSSCSEYYGLYMDDIDNSGANYAIYTNAGDISFGDDVTIRKSFQDIKFSEDGLLYPVLNFAEGHGGSFASATIKMGSYTLIDLGYSEAGAMDAIALGPNKQIRVHGDAFYLDDIIEFYGGLITINDSGDLDIYGKLKTNNGRIVNITRVTSGPHTITTSMEEIFYNTDSVAITVNLPVGVEGQRFRIINSGTSGKQLTITPSGAENLIGVNSSFYLNDGETLIITYNSTDGWC